MHMTPLILLSHANDPSPSLPSRQRYVLGDSAMHRMAKSNVFISGLGGLGAEIGEEEER